MSLLKTIIDNNCLSLQEDLNRWEEAVHFGCQLLEQQGFVSDSYYPSILELTKEYGPYYVIAKGFAMPHARPENGALKTGFSLISLKRPVNFNAGANDPVSLVLVFAAKNKRELNKSAIIQIMNFIDDEKLLQAVREAKSIEDIQNLI